MLITCPECYHVLSDKAFFCPNCGYVTQQGRSHFTRKASSVSKTKPMKLPNGFGQISKINNKNLRNPYRVMVTTAREMDGKPLVTTLKPQAYFPTYDDAYKALLKYNENPYDVTSNITVMELFERWFANYKCDPSKSDSSVNSILSVWKYCSKLYDFPVRELRIRHVRRLIEDAELTIGKETKPASPYTKTRIKSLFNMMLDYAVEYELIEKNYARNMQLDNQIFQQIQEEYRNHISFTDEEMAILWKNLGKVKYVNVLIFQCYSGWRPQELGLIRLENVDLKEEIMKGGIKTEAGTNRIVPIHPKVMPIVEDLYKQAVSLNSEYLINCTDGYVTRSGTKLTYSRYKGRFYKIISSLNLNPAHRPHDGRKHFVTQAKKYHVDEYAIKYIVGHVISDITEKVYTTREISWLKEEIKKIQ